MQCSVHILSLLERKNQDNNNERVGNVNDKPSETLKYGENVYSIKTDLYLNAENPHLYRIDGVHLGVDGQNYERSSQ